MSEILLLKEVRRGLIAALILFVTAINAGIIWEFHLVNDKNNVEREFSLQRSVKIRTRAGSPILNNVSTRRLSLSEEEFSEPSDLLFATEDNKKRQYVLIDISVPHLGIGQKYLLPAKGKVFQKEKNVPASRIKKAIILIRRGIDGVKTLPARIRCPIIEVQLENIVARKTSNKEQDTENRNVHRSDHRNDRNATAKKTVSDAGNEPAPKAPEVVPVTSEMLSALKEAMVYDCISTAYKRTNKYVCRGLWKWIEQIIDSNVHFLYNSFQFIRARPGDRKENLILLNLDRALGRCYKRDFLKENPC